MSKNRARTTRTPRVPTRTSTQPAVAIATKPAAPGAATLDSALFDNLIAQVSPRTTASPEPSIDSVVEEIAEDMVDLLRRVQAIEQGQSAVLTRLEQLESQVEQRGRVIAWELDTLRRDLLGERKTLSTQAIFNGALPTLDALTAIADNIIDQAGTPAHNQIRAAAQSLATMLRTLGLRELETTVGEPFDPQRMECDGYADGAPGVVLQVVRKGYHSEGIIIRPAGVLIADPKIALPSQKVKEGASQ